MLRRLVDAVIGNMHAEPGLHVHEQEGAAPLETREIEGLSTKFINLREFINRRCPSLTESFKPVWWLPNGHLQAFYCVIGNFSKIDKVVYDRKYLRLKDGGTIGLDFTPSTKDTRTHSEDTPVIVVMHGLTGGSHESYVRSIIAPACTPIEKGGLGYRAVVVNFRGCAGTPITSPQFYSAYHTDDLRQALIYLSTLYPKAPFLGLGFSLGANVLVRYLGEEGVNSRLKSGCALGCPWNLWKNNIKLEDGWFYQNVYSRSLGGNLVRAFTKHREVLQQWPDNPVTKAVMEVTSLKKTPLIGQFDQIATRFAGGALAPHGPFPFPSGHDYYVAASSDQLLHSVGVPLLAVNAGDDPVVRALPEDAGKNPFVALMTTHGGGHLGWFTGTGLFGIKRWIVAPVLEWLAATSDNLVDSERNLPRVYTDAEGWITEDGREHLGLKLAEGMDTVVGVEGQEGLLQGL